MEKNQSRFSTLYIIVTCVLISALVLYFRNRALLADIEAFAVRHLFLAWLLMLSLYVFRAFIPFLPSFAFYAMSGRIFPGRFLPFFVSLSGMLLLHILSYLMGYRMQFDIKRRRSAPRWYERAVFELMLMRESLVVRMRRALRDGRFRTVLLFALSPFPQKAFGRICGRSRIRFPVFLSASVIGSLPGMVSATLLGKSLTDPTSPLFYASLILTVIVTASSVMLFQRANSDKYRKPGKRMYSHIKK